LLNLDTQLYLMNSFRQQAVILFALMAFLSAVTVFFVMASPNESQEIAEDNSTQNNSNESHIENIEISEPEGDGLIAQSVKGLIALYRDFNSGVEMFSEGLQNNSEED